MLERCVAQRFMHEKHKTMWTVVVSPGEVVEAIRRAPVWDPNGWSFAAL
jgi:predicted Rossmann-fold nucleotide-binding protein